MSIFNKILPGFGIISRLVFVKRDPVSNNAYKFYRNVLCKASYCSQPKDNDATKNKNISHMDTFVPFEDMIQQKRHQAQKSCVVQVSSENSCSELHEYCQSIAPVDSMFYYTFNGNHFVLVEFMDFTDVDKMFSYNSQGQFVKSPFLWFRATKKKKRDSKPRGPLPMNLGAQTPTQDEVSGWLSAAKTITDEMDILYESTKLSELGIRLRMVCAHQIELALSGLFPQIKAIPFGSTVNSFGKDGCDLDLVLKYGSCEIEEEERRLVYHSKNIGSTTRLQIQRQMELLGDLLQVYIPGATSVKRILGARVPIVKYSHEFTGIDTDISLTNLSGVYMSELLYLMGNLDPASRRLVFSIKAWAKAVGLTYSSPGRWISNFSLTLMTLFYLQTENRLPAVDQLIRESRKEDEKFADDINCTFLRDIRCLNTEFSKLRSPADLLKGFFNYYQNFDFENKSINLCSGKTGSKPDYSPLYIVNPLERSLNVSKNVSLEEVERFRIETRNAAWAIETGGRLNDIIHPTADSRFMNRKYVPRIVTVKDLFS